MSFKCIKELKDDGIILFFIQKHSLYLSNKFIDYHLYV
jgi:hypothetical protein